MTQGNVVSGFAQYVVAESEEDYATTRCLPRYSTGAGPRPCMKTNRKQVNIFYMCTLSHYITHCLLVLLAHILMAGSGGLSLHCIAPKSGLVQNVGF